MYAIDKLQHYARLKQNEQDGAFPHGTADWLYSWAIIIAEIFPELGTPDYDATMRVDLVAKQLSLGLKSDGLDIPNIHTAFMQSTSWCMGHATNRTSPGIVATSVIHAPTAPATKPEREALFVMSGCGKLAYARPRHIDTQCVSVDVSQNELEIAYLILLQLGTVNGGGKLIAGCSMAVQTTPMVAARARANKLSTMGYLRGDWA